MTILHLDVGKAGGRCDGLQISHLPEDLPLVFIAAPGDQDGDGIFLPEGAADLLLGQLPVGLVAEISVVGVEDIVAAVGQHGADHQHHQKDGRENVAEVDDPLSEPVDVGDQIAVAGPFDGAAEQHQQAGHQQKDAQHTEDDALGQHDAHIRADAQLHHHQGHQSGDGGEAGGGDLDDGLAQGGDVSLPGVQAVVPLLHVPVAEDDGVVDGHGQLKDDGDGVGDEGDGSKDEVGPHIQDRGRGKDDQVDGDLHIAFGGEQQHDHDDHRGDGQDHGHLLLKTGRLVPAHSGGGVVVIALQKLLHLEEGGGGVRVVLLSVKGDGEQGRGIVVMVLGIIKFHRRDTRDLFDF